VVGVDVMAGVVAVVDIGRGVAVEEGLRSQGFGGDACMSKEWGRRENRLMPAKRIQTPCQCLHSCECLRVHASSEKTTAKCPHESS